MTALKGGLLTFLSLLFTQNNVQQGGKPTVSGNKPVKLHYHHHHHHFIPNEACFTHNGESGICQTLVECPKYNDKLDYLSKSHCQLTIFDRGVCCPISDENKYEDAMIYAAISSSGRNKTLVFPGSPRISTDDVNNACEIALIEMKQRQELERELVRKNIVAKKGSSTFWHARLFKTTEGIYLLASDATVVLLASISLAKRFAIQKDVAYDTLTQYTVKNTIIKDTCPVTYPCVDTKYKYRSFDGTCNNLLHHDWGSTGIAMRRLIKPHYSDGLSALRLAKSGRLLPSARHISSIVHPERPRHYKNYTLLLMQWGQFLDHDIAHTPLTKGSAFADISCCKFGIYRGSSELHPECLPIHLPDNDTFYSKYGQKCMEFVRSMPAIRHHCTFGPREQMNQITSYIDGSGVYGSSEEEAYHLRNFRGGKLKISKRKGNHLLPQNPSECYSDRGDKFCFKAGDSRVNEQPQLAAMHTLWVRHHNRIVKRLSRLNPGWSDERLYQEGRRIVGAQIQHITYNEFLPIILGRRFMSIYSMLPKRMGYFSGYRDDADATILNSFATAAFRFGHSLVTDHFRTYARDGKLKKKEDFLDSQFAPFALYRQDGVESFLRGLIRQKPRKFDRYFIQELTDRLFAFDKPYGLDLVALNIQRGRDHGIPPYVEWRTYCGIKPANTWDDLLVDMDAKTISELRSMYEDIEDIDLYVGGISEKPLNDSIVGPTFLCILAKQFIRLKIGDRFFYENAPYEKYSRDITAFTPAQLKQIRRTSFARILCANSKNIGSVQPLTFVHPYSLNQRVSCRSVSKIPGFNLFPWKASPMPMNSRTAD